MKNKLYLLILFIISLSISIQADISKDELDTIHRAVRMVNTPEEFIDQQIWPQFRLKPPLIFTWDNGHLFAIGMESSNPSWTQLEVDGKTVLYSEKDEWGLHDRLMEANVAVEDYRAFVFRLSSEPSSHPRPLLTFIHETFHLHQFKYFNRQSQLQGYPDFLNIENLSLLVLEEKVLAEFFKAEGNETRNRLLADFVAVHAMRQHYIQPSSAEWEEDQQKMEGLADYTSMKLVEKTSLFDNFNVKERLALALGSQAKPQGISERAVRGRHYGVGLGLAYALDFVEMPRWKQRIQEDGCSQIELLKEAFPLTVQEVAERVDRLKKLYGFQEIQKVVAAEVNAYQSDISSLIAEFNDADGVSVEIKLSQQLGLTGGGTSKRMLALPNGTTLILGDSSKSATTDNSWIMKTQNLPFLLQGGGNKKFKVSEQTAVQIDGKSYLVRDLINSTGSISFTEFALKNENIEMTSVNHPGLLTITGDAITLEPVQN